MATFGAPSSEETIGHGLIRTKGWNTQATQKSKKGQRVRIAVVSGSTVNEEEVHGICIVHC